VILLACHARAQRGLVRAMRPFAALVLVLAAGLAIGCRRTDGPNVVLITLDTTRADRIGAYGDPAARTPALDALAARGALFERAYSNVPLTLPSHTTILTGLAPNDHGVHDNGRFVVPASLETVAERLAQRGYATGAFVSAFVLDSSFGLDQGFDVYDDETHSVNDPLSSVVPSRRGEQVTDSALAWVAKQGGGPLFLWAHYYDVHAPRRPPPPFDEIGDAYAGELAYMDAQVGRLLDGVENAATARETLVIVIGDHGESLGEHDETTHGIVAYDSTLRVPLIAVGSGFEPGARSRAFVRTEDVAATIFAALGQTPPAGGEGVPLQRVIEVGDAGERVAWFECLGPAYALGWARLSGVRTARWKFTAEPAPAELYDVEADPGETQNRVGEEPEVVARLAAVYAALTGPQDPQATAPDPLDPEVEEQLAALGYVSAPQQFAPGEVPDPRHSVRLLGLVRRAQALARKGRLADSIEALELLSLDPSIRAVALRQLARIHSVAGRIADAVEVYETLVTLTGALEARVALSGALLSAGRPKDALAVLDDIEAGPGGTPVSVTLARGRAQLRLGRPAAAASAADEVLERAPAHDAALALASRARVAAEGAAAEIPRLQSLLDDPPPGAGPLAETRGLLATLLRREARDTEAVQVLEASSDPPPGHLAILADIARTRGNLERAARLYEAWLERVPAANEARRELADAYDVLGRLDDALALYDDLVALDPSDATLYVDRGAVLFRARRMAEAEADFRAAIALDDQLPEADFNLALLALGQERDSEAEPHLLRAVELRPDFAKAHFHLARLYRRRGDPRAAEHAERAARASGSVAGDTRPLPPVAAGADPPDTKAGTR
jgi:arylsulfatase A-like enzyme/Flp pilus assembly protein TadD